MSSFSWTRSPLCVYVRTHCDTRTRKWLQSLDKARYVFNSVMVKIRSSRLKWSFDSISSSRKNFHSLEFGRNTESKDFLWKTKSERTAKSKRKTRNSQVNRFVQLVWAGWSDHHLSLLSPLLTDRNQMKRFPQQEPKSIIQGVFPNPMQWIRCWKEHTKKELLLGRRRRRQRFVTLFAMGSDRDDHMHTHVCVRAVSSSETEKVCIHQFPAAGFQKHTAETKRMRQFIKQHACTNSWWSDRAFRFGKHVTFSTRFSIDWKKNWDQLDWIDFEQQNGRRTRFESLWSRSV